MAPDDRWQELDGLVKEIYSGSRGVGASNAEPRAKLDSALARLLVEQMRQSISVIYPALTDLGSEIKKHREALETAARSSDKSARAMVLLTVALVFATLLSVVVPLFK